MPHGTDGHVATLRAMLACTADDDERSALEAALALFIDIDLETQGA